MFHQKIMQQLLLMFCMGDKQKIYPVYVSKNNSNCEKQVILLMISDREKCEDKFEGRR